MRATSNDYYRVLLSLRPRGPAWAEDDNDLLAHAEELARAHNRSVDLLDEADPRSALEMLEAWERVCGLPDECSGSFATTVAERRQAVVNKLTSRGGQSIAYFEALATALGYDVTITERRPFTCGKSECGGPDELAPGAIRHLWSVLVHGPRVVWFEMGQGELGADPFAKITRAEDLECLLTRYKPAQSRLTVGYEGV